MPRKSSLEYSARWRLLYPFLAAPLSRPTVMELAVWVQWLAAGALGTPWVLLGPEGEIRECPRPTARQLIWARWVVRQAMARQRWEMRGWTLYPPAK